MAQKVSDKELIAVTIDRYTDLQQLKKANSGHEKRYKQNGSVFNNFG